LKNESCSTVRRIGSDGNRSLSAFERSTRLRYERRRRSRCIDGRRGYVKRVAPDNFNRRYRASFDFRALGANVVNKTTINLVVALAVAGIIFYIGEEETSLVLIALFGIGYLVFANGIIKVA
jgi:hypothetical protein